MIYFIQAVSGGLIKIGTTIQLSNRLRQLESDRGQPLKVLAVMEGSYPVERELHAQFAHLNEDGEWFLASDDLVEFIAHGATPWDGEDEASPLRSIVSLKGSDELEGWLDELAEHSESGTRTNALRRALKAFAEREKFDRPMPKR